jgi:hypothetical protein
VELVKVTQQLADSLQDTLVLTTTVMQRIIDECLTNRFCPNAVLPK